MEHGRKIELDIPNSYDNYTYKDWFGEGNTLEDIGRVLLDHKEEPLHIFIEKNGYMATIIFKDKCIVTGYDGNEYKHYFVMEDKIKSEEI